MNQNNQNINWRLRNDQSRVNMRINMPSVTARWQLQLIIHVHNYGLIEVATLIIIDAEKKFENKNTRFNNDWIIGGLWS